MHTEEEKERSEPPKGNHEEELQKPLIEQTQPSLSPPFDHQQSGLFNARARIALNKELMLEANNHFSMYSPFYHFAIPAAVNSIQEEPTPEYRSSHADFSYMHAARNRHFDWMQTLRAPRPLVNYDVIKRDIAFVTPPKVIVPEEVREPYRCDQCGKVFKTKYTLAIHLKMPNHTFARPFVCNTCGKGFRLSSTLCRHKIIHTKEKPYKCHVCQKAFNRSSTLKTHVRTHSLEKEFVCDRCGKGFHQKGNLRNHILIHTGEKPYKCTLCQKAFNKLSNLKFHMHVHTDNSPYRCKICKVSFSRRCDLKSHVQNVHSTKESELLN